MRTKKSIFAGQSSYEFYTEMLFDFASFIKRVFDPHKTFGNEFSAFHTEQLKILDGGRYICLLSPRGHLKTTIFSIYYPLWKLITEPKCQICLVSSTQRQATDIMSRIQAEIDNNELLQDLLPASRADTWNKGEINTAMGGKLYVLPFNDTIRGHHVDYFICDDIIRETKMNQEEAKKLFWSVIYPCIQTRKGKLIVVGTPINHDDLLAEITGKDEDGSPLHPEFVCQRNTAVKMDEDGNWIEPTWKEQFTLTELENIRRAMGPLSFDREYLCNPFAGSSAVFSKEILDSQIHSGVSNNPNETSQYFLGVDVAMSKAIKADYSVFSVIEKRENGLYYQVWLERYKGKTTSEQIEIIRRLNRTFRFTNIVVEKRGLSEGMVADLLDDDELRSVIVPFVTTHNSKEGIIVRLQGALACKSLFVLDDDIQLKEFQSFGIKEKKDAMGVIKITFEALTGHDDTVIALGLAYDGASQSRGQFHFEVI